MTILDAAQLDAWLMRLGIAAPPSPTLQSLDAVLAAHLASIPFENVDPLLRRPVRIDLDAVFDKLVTRRRGGYCFELNTLLSAALGALGYEVTPLAARVRWGVPDDVPTMTSHMLLRVEVAHRSYVVDVGFGGPTPFRAMPLSEPADDGFPYRLAPSPAQAAASAFHSYDLQARGDAGWIPVYRFDLTPQPPIDFEARNWYVSTHPDSVFLQRLMAARTDGGTRVTLANGELAERAPDGSVRRTHLRHADAVVQALSQRFGIVLDHELRQGLMAALPGLLAPATASAGG
ncbi:Arylamine N-acetyltransferase [Cupriavidus taiwanensis]|uniref:Arylamine N-acetyltransferase n=1 Tax=Cupriavidus taiwanensis TaxID=164546 RepID=A0A976B0E5_9BURK|nr:arylamine N-acetyltransferase [Cupriavidus taiwanensis]SOZ64212.1 Arylamine N-acetyltransferase [Cupriavidus taiwanensis]SOZ64957.1 Arylamine N-acetyltransferase [Cupriavidus taiwanensis]SOZ68702.1 Arylamine N-acetyltransferase [Cupriavidus taiwanensis]SPA08094.1 Arylamine N-acetyltransferase [Cupriavidus taiwanensis]